MDRFGQKTWKSIKKMDLKALPTGISTLYFTPKIKAG